MKLLGEPRRLRELGQHLNSQGWELTELVLQTERQEHLELAAESDDPEAREGHRIVSRWIKGFLGMLNDIKTVDEESRHPEMKPNMDPSFMEQDSGTYGEPEDSVPLT